MKIFDARGKIKDIKDARNVAEKIGGAKQAKNYITQDTRMV